MKLPDLKPGKYVLAVSGGVDSMALLDLLSNLPEVEVLVAHFNHGIREDSDADEELVILAAQKYERPIEVGYGNLGQSTSEEAARQGRYEFLKSVQKKHGALSIITAHHQDDLIETALINVLRGTGPQGLVAISTNPEIIRPLLAVSKKEVYEYARARQLAWREDQTNQSDDYLRNYIRQNIIPKMSARQKEALLKNINKVAVNKDLKDDLLKQLSDLITKDGQISRAKFAELTSDVAMELLVFWLRQRGIRDFDKKTVDRLNVLIRTASSGTSHNVKNGLWLNVNKLTAQFEHTV